MSQKHNQRTRAEILAKRAQPIQEVRVIRTIPSLKGPLYVPQPTHSEKLRTAFDASKYMPHIGAKEQERAKRCYMSHYINQKFVDHYDRTGVILLADQIHDRVTPTLCQMSKRQYAATLSTVTDARWSEYESVF
jgi:hypothetical protein